MLSVLTVILQTPSGHAGGKITAVASPIDALTGWIRRSQNWRQPLQGKRALLIMVMATAVTRLPSPH